MNTVVLINANIFAFSHPGYFGKVGMRHYHMTRNKYHRPTVNLDRLWSLVSEQTRTYYQNKTEVAPVIDVIRAVSVAMVCLIAIPWKLGFVHLAWCMIHSGSRIFHEN